MSEGFDFGDNWRAYLACLDAGHIARAREALAGLLGVESLEGKTFLDIGCGSGIASLAAALLGAEVRSFDLNPKCVECARSLKAKFGPPGATWSIEPGSALDEDFLRSLGQYDVVYSWGVLHHTGDLWKALAIAALPVKEGGILALAIYNDQGCATQAWRLVKRAYNLLPPPLRFLVFYPALIRLWGPTMIKDLFRGRPLHTWRHYGGRGMSPWFDVVDWVGGYPFEAAKPEKVISFFSLRGFSLERLLSADGGSGCNEFRLRNTAPAGSGKPRPRPLETF